MMREDKNIHNTLNGECSQANKLKDTDVVKLEDEKRMPEAKKPKLQSIDSKNPKKIDEKNAMPESRAPETKNEELNRLIERKKLPRISRRFQQCIRIEKHPIGGGNVISCDFHEVKRKIQKEDVKKFARQFSRLAFAEHNRVPVFCIAVMENAAEDIRDQFAMMVEEGKKLNIRVGTLTGKYDNGAKPLSEYREEVLNAVEKKSFCFAPLNEVSMVGPKKEEIGKHFEGMLEELEKSPFLAPLMPWGEFSILEGTKPTKSEDGPIFWVRPGEQMIPTDLNKRTIEADNRKYSYGTRATKFLDRTPAHIDVVKDNETANGLKSTAAVGVLQGIKSEKETGSKSQRAERRKVKDVVVFYPGHVDKVVEDLRMDVTETPASQCATWVDETKLESMRQKGIRYAKLELCENDIYFLPRNVVHQFRTIGPCCSVAWHVRLRHYYNNQVPPPSSF